MLTLNIIKQSERNELIKAWLLACLAKTIKEDVNSSIPIAGFAD
jgi:hypothetical protein